MWTKCREGRSWNYEYWKYFFKNIAKKKEKNRKEKFGKNRYIIIENWLIWMRNKKIESDSVAPDIYLVISHLEKPHDSYFYEQKIFMRCPISVNSSLWVFKNRQFSKRNINTKRTVYAKFYYVTLNATVTRST